MSYAGSIQRYSGSVGAVPPPPDLTAQPTPQNVLAAAVGQAISASQNPGAYLQAGLALTQCPNLFDAIYQQGQLVPLLQNWASGGMGMIDAANLCTKLDQLRQDLNAMQAPPAPASTPPSNAEATGQPKKSYKGVLFLGGLVVAMGGLAWWSTTHAHGARRN